MLVFAKRSALSCSPLHFARRGVWAQGWQHIGAVQRVGKAKGRRGADREPCQSAVSPHSMTALSVFALRRKVIFPRIPPGPSSATPQSPTIEIADSKNELKMTAGNTVVVIQKSPLLIRFADMAGNVLLADEPTLPMAFDGSRVHVWKKMPVDENYTVWRQNRPDERRNRRFHHVEHRRFGWGDHRPHVTRPSLFSWGCTKVPLGGVFFDNTYRRVFDFGKESPDYCSFFGAEGGELNYYFFSGPDPKKVVEQ